MWVNPYLQQRAQKGRFFKDVSTTSHFLQTSKNRYKCSFQFDDMMTFESEFSKNFHMKPDQFEELHQRLRHRLEPKRYTLEYVF